MTPRPPVSKWLYTAFPDPRGSLENWEPAITVKMWMTSKAPPRELSFSLEFPEKTSEVVCFALPVSYPVCLLSGTVCRNRQRQRDTLSASCGNSYAHCRFDKKNLTRSYSFAVADNDALQRQQVQHKVITFLPQVLKECPKHTLSPGVEETHQFYASF